jgi:hypothetical protein
MSLDLSFHNITALKADAKIERHSQFADLTLTDSRGAVTTLTIHFDSKAKARKFAAMVNLAHVANDRPSHFDTKAASQALEDATVNLIQTMRANPRKCSQSHPDAFAIEDEFAHDYDEERREGWAVSVCGND